MSDAPNREIQIRLRKQAVEAIAKADGPSAAFEYAAELFYLDTGMMAIGKDDALGHDSYEKRSAAWIAWRKEHDV